MADDIERTAKKIRDTYCRLRSAATGVNFNPGTFQDNVWARIAAWCLEEDINPVDYVSDHFDTESGTVPSIGDLAAASTMAKYTASGSDAAALDTDAELIIAKVAEQVQATYCRAREMYCSSRFSPGKQYAAHWNRVARWCVAYSIDPREYLEVQFHVMKPYPYIKDIATEAAVRRFFEHRGERASEVSSNVKISQASFNRLRGIGKSVRDILTDPNQDFDLLFKYITSKREGLEDLAAIFFDGAVIVYLSSVYFDTVYSNQVPEQLRLAAEKVRGCAR